MKIIITAQTLYQWRRLQQDLAGWFTSVDLYTQHSAYNGIVTIKEYREVLDVHGPLASWIALKHPDWLYND